MTVSISVPEFEQLFRTWYPWVWRIAFHRVNDRVLAQEIASELMFILWKDACTGNLPPELGRWLYQRAVWESSKMRKRLPPLRGLEGSEEDRFRAVEAKMLRDYANHNDFGLGEAVRIALSMLTEDHRKILEMKYYRDLTEKATSTELGISLGTVKSRLSRAKEALRDILHELGFTESHAKVQGGSGDDS